MTTPRGANATQTIDVQVNVSGGVTQTQQQAPAPQQAAPAPQQAQRPAPGSSPRESGNSSRAPQGSPAKRQSGGAGQIAGLAGQAAGRLGVPAGIAGIGGGARVGAGLAAGLGAVGGIGVAAGAAAAALYAVAKAGTAASDTLGTSAALEKRAAKARFEYEKNRFLASRYGDTLSGIETSFYRAGTRYFQGQLGLGTSQLDFPRTPSGSAVAAGQGTNAALHEGGMVRGSRAGTNVTVGEGNNPEIVTPLTDLPRYIEQGFRRALVSQEAAAFRRPIEAQQVPFLFDSSAVGLGALPIAGNRSGSTTSTDNIPIIFLTQAEYDALETERTDVIYAIEAEGITTAVDYLPTVNKITLFLDQPVPNGVTLPAVINSDKTWTYSLTRDDRLALSAIGLGFTASSRSLAGLPTVLGDFLVNYVASSSIVRSQQFIISIVSSSAMSAEIPEIGAFNWQEGVPIPSGLTTPEVVNTFETWNYTVNGLPRGVSYTSSTRTFSGNPSQNGSFVATLTAISQSGRRLTKTFTVVVKATVGTEAYLPVPSPIIATVGVPYAAEVLPAVANSSDTWAYSVTGLPNGWSFEAGTRQVNGTSRLAGSFPVIYRARSGGITLIQTLTIMVREVTDNELPSPGNFSLVTGERIDEILPAVVGSIGWTYSIPDLPSGLTFTALTRRLTGSPSPGIYTATYTATKGTTTLTASFGIVVVAANLAVPVLPSIPSPQTVALGATVSIQLPTVERPGSNTYTYTVSGEPTELTFSAGNQTLNGTTATVGRYNILYTATPASGTALTRTFVLIVEQA